MTSTTDDLREAVRRKYADAATTVAAGGAGCCGSEPSCCGDDGSCTDDRFGPHSAIVRAVLPAPTTAKEV